MIKRIGAMTWALAVAASITVGIPHRAWSAEEAPGITGPDWIDPATYRLMGDASEDTVLSWLDYRFDIDYRSLRAGLEAAENSGIGSSDETDIP